MDGIVYGRSLRGEGYPSVNTAINLVEKGTTAVTMPRG